MRFTRFKRQSLTLHITVTLFLCGIFPASAFPALPGPADAGRINPQQEAVPPPPQKNEGTVVPESTAPLVQAPPGAEKIKLVLKEVDFEGVTAFKPEELRDIYTPYIGQKVTMDIAWMMAGQLTERYRKEGYFLSQAYVPEQHIKGGKITISVIEGYIGQIDLDDKTVADHFVVKALINRMLSRKPVKSNDVESFLLRMNDLPGLTFRAVLSPLTGAEKKEGAIKLTLLPGKKENADSLSVDNFGSRFLGPQEATLDYQMSLLPLQQSEITLLSAYPLNNLYSASLKHTLPLFTDASLTLTGSTTNAYPGYTLTPLKVGSVSNFAGFTINYQPLRQRLDNLSLRIGFDGRDTNANTFAGPLTREHIRALRLGANYTGIADKLGGQSSIDASLSQGTRLLGASNENDPDLSRAHAVPDFTKLDMTLSRLQSITRNWYAVSTLTGQTTHDILYSSEEFGYGGQALGRAYDSSEIIGDKGAAGSVELRYNGFYSVQPLAITPYTFYDIGKVWSNSPNTHPMSGSSAGLGFRFTAPTRIEGITTLAFPLTKPEANPIYGGSGTGPRILFQILKRF